MGYRCCMAEPLYLREPVIQGQETESEPSKYCAYNKSRERFLCSDVEGGDFTPATRDSRLRNLAPVFGGGVWMVPFRGISPTSVRIPIDLIYLDQNFAVLEVVESFPLETASSQGEAAASVLALPADTIASAEVRAGDHLVVSPPAEMRRWLRELKAEREALEAEANSPEPAATAQRSPHGRVLPWVDRSRTAKAAEEDAAEAGQAVPPATPEPVPAAPSSEPEIRAAAPAQDAPKVATQAKSSAGPAALPAPANETALEVHAEPIQKAKTPARPPALRTGTPASRRSAARPAAQNGNALPKARSAPAGVKTASIKAATARVAAEVRELKPKAAMAWLHKFLHPETQALPPRAVRQSAQELAAFFFTGGNASAHAVRDISMTGLYLLTEERWYPGTVIRITLMDRTRPKEEQALMIYASVVRWGNDGVGLQFVFPDEKEFQAVTASLGGMQGGATRAEVEDMMAGARSSR